MTALLIIGAALCCCAAVLIGWASCVARKAGDAASDAEIAAFLASERARTEMRERLIHARIREGRR